MDAMEAISLAECIELELGTACTSSRVECFAVPLRPSSTRRRSRWTFLVVTDAPERTLRDVLTCMQVDVVQRRGTRRVYTAWPEGAT